MLCGEGARVGQAMERASEPSAGLMEHSGHSSIVTYSTYIFLDILICLLPVKTAAKYFILVVVSLFFLNPTGNGPVSRCLGETFPAKP